MMVYIYFRLVAKELNFPVENGIPTHELSPVHVDTCTQRRRRK